MQFRRSFVDIWLTLFCCCLLSGKTNASGKRCEENMSFCLKDLTSVLNDSQLAFAQNAQQLDTVCGHLKKTVSCVLRFISDCLDPDKQAYYRSMITGTKMLTDRLCTKGAPFRRQYLQHANCYHRLRNVYQKCAQDYYENEKQRITIAERNNDQQEELRLWCCNHDNHRRCTKNAVNSKCGSDAAELAEQIVNISGGEVVNYYCTNYTSNFTLCPNSTEAPLTLSSIAPPEANLDGVNFSHISRLSNFLLLPSTFIALLIVRSRRRL